MITRFITEVTTRFNPFSARAKSARLFLSFLPANARAQGMNVTTQLLPRSSTEPSSLYIKFSQYTPSLLKSGGDNKGAKESEERRHDKKLTRRETEDGKEMKLDCEAMNIKSIVEEVDRHSRALQKADDLANA
jgi:large subunit ribosomal protein L53